MKETKTLKRSIQTHENEMSLTFFVRLEILRLISIIRSHIFYNCTTGIEKNRQQAILDKILILIKLKSISMFLDGEKDHYSIPDTLTFPLLGREMWRLSETDLQVKFFPSMVISQLPVRETKVKIRDRNGAKSK